MPTVSLSPIQTCVGATGQTAVARVRLRSGKVVSRVVRPS